MAQWYAQVGGQRYGPITEDELRSWIAQGRVQPTDFVWCEGMANWLPASSALPGATPTTPPAYSPGAAMPGMLPAGVQPHRGTTILVLGILGLVCCIICGIIAWVMGNNDLRQMAAGTMDRSGEGATKAGKICGMISVLLALAGILFYVVMFIFMGAAAFHARRF
jgi:hypothetical protein